MSIPSYQALMLPVLRLAAEGERRLPETTDAVADLFNLTEEERSQLFPSGERIIYNRVYWAKDYLNKAGLVDIPARGRFIASAAGKALLQTNPPTITLDTLKRYPAFLQFWTAGTGAATPSEGATASGAAEDAATPEEQIGAADKMLRTVLKADLIQRILAQSPAFFERTIIALLVAMGYGGSHSDAARQLGGSGDGGVDGVIDEDRLGLDRIYVQAKRYASTTSVGRPDVQGFVGSLVGRGATKGVFVTTSSFSAQAVDFVRHLTQRVILIDGDRLAELMVEHGVGVRVKRIVEVKQVAEDFFSEE